MNSWKDSVDKIWMDEGYMGSYWITTTTKIQKYFADPNIAFKDRIPSPLGQDEYLFNTDFNGCYEPESEYHFAVWERKSATGTLTIVDQ